MKPKEKHQCVGRVIYFGRSCQCVHNGKNERDGKHYCGRHDPVAKETKRAVTLAKSRADVKCHQKMHNDAMSKEAVYIKMWEALEDIIEQFDKTNMLIGADLADSINVFGRKALDAANKLKGK